MSDLVSWDGLMTTSLNIPGMKINRNEFLESAFKNYGDSNELIIKRPIDVFDEKVLEKVADDICSKHVMMATGASTLAGIPGGLAMFGTVPADLAQYYAHVLVLAQKLGYIYGWPDLLDENNNVTEGTKNVLTLFVGVMFGAQSANKAIAEVGKNMSVQVAKRLPQQALTKTSYYPVIKEIGKWIGLKVTKETFAKGLGKVIPIIGGGISGVLTFASFKPMANKLRKHLREEMYHTKSFDSTDNKNFTFDDAEIINDEINIEYTKILVCINVAVIDFDLNEDEAEFITSIIEESTLTDDEKMDLLNKLHKKEHCSVDLSEIKNNELYAVSLVESLAQIIKIDGIVKPSEKIYFYKITNELGFSKEDVKELLGVNQND